MEGDNKAIKRFLRSHGAGSHTSTVTTPAAGVTPTFRGSRRGRLRPRESELGDFDGTVALEVFTDDETLLLDSARRIAERLGVDF